MMVNVPRALMIGRTPIDRYMFAPISSGAAASFRTPRLTPQA